MTTTNQTNNNQQGAPAVQAATPAAESGIYFALAGVQNELRAPKDATNSFGGYNYRSAESILTKVKPLLAKVGLAIIMNDEVVQVGDRYYVKSTATVIDCNTGATGSASALARESLDRKGSDQAQVTGACSSYARKYALGGLFGISDAADDPDSRDNRDQGHSQQRPQQPQQNRGGQGRPQQQTQPWRSGKTFADMLQAQQQVQQAAQQAAQTVTQAVPQVQQAVARAAQTLQQVAQQPELGPGDLPISRIAVMDRIYRVMDAWPQKHLADQIRHRYKVRAVNDLTDEQAEDCAAMLEKCEVRWKQEAGKQKGAA